ncbi:MAG: hypothetical protein Ct9H300mP27_08430 [Chloroflexota bacterium]|nr:MAG: hypothetical protein Ct9H300mP27_08430 [Chloroflexota bacterium]
MPSDRPLGYKTTWEQCSSGISFIISMTFVILSPFKVTFPPPENRKLNENEIANQRIGMDLLENRVVHGHNTHDKIPDFYGSI